MQFKNMLTTYELLEADAILLKNKNKDYLYIQFHISVITLYHPVTCPHCLLTIFHKLCSLKLFDF